MSNDKAAAAYYDPQGWTPVDGSVPVVPPAPHRRPRPAAPTRSPETVHRALHSPATRGRRYARKPPRFDIVLGLGLILLVTGCLAYRQADTLWQMAVVAGCIAAGAMLLSQAIYSLVCYLKEPTR